MVVGLEVHCELATAHQAVLRLPQRLRRRAQHQRLPGVPRPARARCRCSTARRWSWPCGSAPALHCSVEPSIFHRKNYFYPDMPKDYQVSQYDEPINVGGYLDLPDGSRVGITRAHMEEDTGKTTHVRRGRAHPRRRPLPRRLQPGRRAAGRDRQRARHPLIAEQAKAYVERAAGHPRGHRRVRRPDGGGVAARRRQRLHAAGRRRPSSAPGARSRTSTRCGRWAGPSSTRRAARWACCEAGEHGRAGDPPLERGRGPHVVDALQGGGLRLPVLPRARPGAAGPVGGVAGRRGRARCRRCRPSAGRRLAEAAGVDAADAVATVVALGLDELVLAAVAAGADGRLALNRAANELAADIEPPAGWRPPPSPSCCVMEGDGS